MRETAWSRKKTFPLRPFRKARVAGWLYLLPKIMSFLVGGGREKEREAGSSNISGESNNKRGGNRNLELTSLNDRPPSHESEIRFVNNDGQR